MNTTPLHDSFVLIFPPIAPTERDTIAMWHEATLLLDPALAVTYCVLRSFDPVAHSLPRGADMSALQVMKSANARNVDDAAFRIDQLCALGLIEWHSPTHATIHDLNVLSGRARR